VDIGDGSRQQLITWLLAFLQFECQGYHSAEKSLLWEDALMQWILIIHLICVHFLDIALFYLL
jgi:hypothetical protein